MELSFVIYVELLCLTVQSYKVTLNVERRRQDIIRNVSETRCTTFKGVHNIQSNDCLCPSASPSLIRVDENMLSCKRMDEGVCHYTYQTNLNMFHRLYRLNDQLHESLNCLNPMFSVLDGQTSIPDTLMEQLKNDKVSSNGSTWFYGRVVKAEYGCIRKCFVIKIKGTNRYIINHSSNANTTIELILKVTALPQSLVNFGVVGAIFSIMLSLCAFVIIFLHYRPLSM